MRCLSCKYDLTSLGEAATCPECGLDEAGRGEFIRKRRGRVRTLTKVYVVITGFALLPAIPLLILAVWSLLHLAFWPWPPSLRSWLHENDSGMFALCMFPFAVLIYLPILLTPVLLCMLPLVIWKRSRFPTDLRTPVWLWGVMLAPLVVPTGWLLVAILDWM